MEIEFYKYQGAGNDFVIIDNSDNIFPTENREYVIAKLCRRKTGIGSDGLMLMEPSEVDDFHMTFYNPDGSQSFCGNGSRCAVLFAHQKKWVNENLVFDTPQGRVQANVISNDIVSLDMFDVNKVEANDDFIYLNTGSPHYIQFVDNVEDVDVIKEGSGIRYNSRFKDEGTNVNFVEITENGIKVRTYERGVENETLSCGTGVTAAAMAYGIKTNQDGVLNIPVTTLGGDFKIKFLRKDNSFTNVKLVGPAQFVFKGTVNV